jgi:hypothetical protein
LYALTIGSFAEFAGGGVPRRKNAPKTLVEVYDAAASEAALSLAGLEVGEMPGD